MALESIGTHKFRSGKEAHLYNPRTIHLLQQAVRTGDYSLFGQYTDLVDQENDEAMNLRKPPGILFPRGRRYSAGRGRTCFRDRQAVQDRRHELWLHLSGGPRDAGHRHEPSARPSATPVRAAKRRSVLSSSPANAIAAARSSRWPAAASA